MFTKSATVNATVWLLLFKEVYGVDNVTLRTIYETKTFNFETDFLTILFVIAFGSFVIGIFTGFKGEK